MNTTRRLKSFTALTLSLCMGLQFNPVLGEETEAVETTDLSNSTFVDFSLDAYIAHQEDAEFVLGLSFDEGAVIHTGDTMSLTLPEGYAFSDVTEALPVYALRDGVPGEMLATYTISGNVLSLVGNEMTDLTGITAEITLTGTPVETETEGYYTEKTWTMGNHEDGTANAVTFRVPSGDILNWSWVSEDGAWTTTVEAIQETADGTTLVLSNNVTTPATYSFALPEGLTAANTEAETELSYTPMNPDGTRSQESSVIGSYNVIDNVLTAAVTAVPTEPVAVSLPFTWNEAIEEPVPTETPDVVDEELIDVIQEENGLLDETPETTPAPEVTATPEPKETPVAENEVNLLNEGTDVYADDQLPIIIVGENEWEYDSAKVEKNGTSTNVQDIFWIDNSNGEETRNTFTDKDYAGFKNLFSTDNFALIATVLDSEGNKTAITFNGNDFDGIDNDALSQLFGITGSLTKYIQIEDLGGTGHLRLSLKGLPSRIPLTRTVTETVTDEDGNQSVIEKEESTTLTISDWSFSLGTDADGKLKEPVADGYSFNAVTQNADGSYVDQNGRERPGAASLGAGWYFVQKTDYNAHIILRRGNNTLATADDVDTLQTAIKDAYAFYYDTGIAEGLPGALSGSLELDGTGALAIEDTGFGVANAVPTLEVTVGNLEKYNLDGSEIIYNIDQKATPDEPDTNKSNVINSSNFSSVFGNAQSEYYGDYLAEEIENDSVSNHGTDTTKCYDGGIIYLTLTGETDYEATKIWEDKYAQEKDQMRPDVEFELWRYTVTNDTDPSTAYQHASPVQATVDRDTGSVSGQSLQVATDVLEGETAAENNTNYSIDFKPDFVAKDDNYESITKYLPKYDAEGNRYVYFARETMSGTNANRYRVEYGSLENGVFVEKADEMLPDGLTERGDGDTSIYNGGVVSNVLNDTTSATVRKTWIADAFQSELGDVDVVFTLQRSSDNGKTWESVKNTEGNNLTYTMGKSDDPFSAENLIQEHTENVPTYDNEGNILQYRWVETAIKQNGNDIELKDDGTFVLTQNGESVTYTSYVQDMEREERVTSIINEIDDKTQYHVHKEWEGFEEGFQGSPVSLVMYRSNSVHDREKLLLKDGDTISEDQYFQLDGTIDADRTELYVKNPEYDNTDPESEEYILAGYVQETKEWYAEFTELDLYDIGGSPFDYIVLERNEGTNWDADYSTEIIDVNGEEVVLMTIVNRPIGGSQIYVRKRWLDDGDEQHRGDVTMTAYAINFSDTVTADTFTFDNLTRLGEEVLNRGNNWWGRIGISAKPGTEENPQYYTANEIIVLETTIADAKPGEVGARDTVLGAETYTAEQLHKIYDDQHSQQTDDEGYVQYETRFHKYEATFSMEELEGVQFYTVTNRRLGNINLTVTKNWVDGATGTVVPEQRSALIEALDDKGYDLVMQLVPSETQDFDVDDPEIGVNYVLLVNEQVPIQKPKDPDNPEGEKETTTSVQIVDSNDSTSKYYFWNLPKYNENGKIVRYTVKEMAQNQNTGELKSLNEVIEENQISSEYVFDMQQTSYFTYDGLQPDDQWMTATNRLSATKHVFFWKEWNDAYRLQLGQRPDIYLDLYQSVEGTNEVSDLYRQGSWTFYDDPDITFFDYGYLPKYDEEGKEYIYYAQEKMNLANALQFDYQPVDYKYEDSLEDSSMSEESKIDSVIELLENSSSIGDESGYAISLQNEDRTDEDRNPLLLQNGADGPYLLKEYGVFSISIQADVEISGKKIWANVPSGFEDADLVDVTFYLFKYLPDDDIPTADDSIVYGQDNGKETITLNGNSPTASITINDWEDIRYQGEYKFSLQYYNENINTVNKENGEITVKPASGTADNGELQKYDKDGNLYTYVLRERGYFGDSDAAADDENGDGIGFVFKQPTINNFAITNTYTGTLGEISLRKILDLNGYELQQNDKKSSVSFRLTREYKVIVDGNETWRTETGFYQDKVISYDDLVDGTEDITFDNLEIYAPNGNKYRYTVTENPAENNIVQGGYNAYGQVGLVDENGFKADGGSYDSNLRLEEVPNEDGSISYQLKDIYLYPKQAEASQNVLMQFIDFIAGIPEAIGLVEPQAEEPDNSSATFLNVYERKFAPLLFDKEWSDFGQSATRFTVPMQFDVYRSANAQSGQGNAISEYKVGELTIELTEEAGNQHEVVLNSSDGTYGKFTIQDDLVQNGTQEMDRIEKITITADGDDTVTLGGTSHWNIKIENFSIYAPNGMPWNYRLTEADAYPYTATTDTLRFTYDKEDEQFKANNTSNFVNDISVSVKAGKTIRDAENVNTETNPNIVEGLWNYTGFDITLNYEIYAKFVVADQWDSNNENDTATAKYQLLHELTGNEGSEWISLADQFDNVQIRNPYAGRLIEVLSENSTLPETYSGFRQSIEYKNNSSFRSKDTDAISNLPRVFTYSDGAETKLVYASYILVETGLEMRDPDNKLQGSEEGTPVYTQEFTPTFCYTEMPGKEVYENLYTNQRIYQEGDSVVTYYLTTTAQILGNNGMTDTEYHFMKPLFDSEEDAKLISEDVKNFTFTNVEMLPIVWIDHANTNSSNSFTNEQVNTIDVTTLRVRKTWDGDNDNWYGTRYVEGDKWVVNYQLQVSIDNKTWIDLDIDSFSQTIIDGEGKQTANSKYEPITGIDAEDTNYVDYINLPANGIIKVKTHDDATNTDSYQYYANANFTYRVREINPDGTVIEDKGRYNEAYEVTYPGKTVEDPDGENIDTYGIKNTLKDTEFYAEKSWNDFGQAPNSLTSNITFELQYLKDMGTDAYGKDIPDEWVSFDIHDSSGKSEAAIVTLNGEKDTYSEGSEPLYYEYESWGAKWRDVPEVMPGSVKDEYGKTRYRVVEVILDNNAYATDVGVTGSGTSDDPYVLVGSGSDSDPYSITNELTLMRVSKTVQRPDGSEKIINDSILNQEFKFTIKPDSGSIPDSAKYLIYQKVENKNPEIVSGLVSLKDSDSDDDGVVDFVLKDGQYAEIYGLKKGVQYTVTEQAIKDDGSLDYKVTYQLTEYQLQNDEATGDKIWVEVSSDGNKVTLPSNKPDNVKVPGPVIAVTNERLGKVTITKTDLDGKTVEGMTFRLEEEAKENEWVPAQMWNPDDPDNINGWVNHPDVTSDEDGIVIFKNLALDKSYRLREVSAPGYHKYPIDIKFDLPYKPTDGDKPNEDGDYYYSIDSGKDAGFYYPEIKMTIENDKAFIMPQTSGTGFFWPGMIGVAVSVLSAGGYAVTRRKKKREEEETVEVN